MSSTCVYINRNSGISETADFINGILTKLNEHLRQNITSEPINDAFKSLIEISKECSMNNWDGYGAQAISEGSIREANRFIEALPKINFPFPSITVDPDGEITFEWINKTRKIFSVSIGHDGTLTYAGIFGTSKTHGTEDFEDAIPKTILDNIKRVFS